MRLATPDMTGKIDKYAIDVLNIPERTLMERAGLAVASASLSLVSEGSDVVIFAGKGNNGGDGYAAASALSERMRVTVVDVFSAGQRSDAGKYWLSAARERGVRIIPMPTDVSELLRKSDLVVDAVFGTGFVGECPEVVRNIAAAVNSLDIKVVAVDVPIGVNAADGSVEPFALRSDITVELSFIKVGLTSYPARELVGEIILDTLGLECVGDKFEFNNFLVDATLAGELLPKRAKNSNKGTFGRAQLITGSDKYRGAAHLSLEAALRGGAGYVIFTGDESLCSELRMKLPEAIYNLNMEAATNLSETAATLVGSGSSCSESLALLVCELIGREGAPLVLDADAINSLAKFASAEIFLGKKRKIILTPHPLEFSRISGYPLEYINANRIECAREFAKKYGVTLLLKGAATVITDGELTYINSSGSSALAKAGSGDVLAGLLVSLLAQSWDVTQMAALAAYLHGRAGDLLEEELSAYGVTPSDLPVKIAQIILSLTKGKI